MRTRMSPNCRVRQNAEPDSPLCAVGATCDQSVVPKGMSEMRMRHRREANRQNRPHLRPIRYEARSSGAVESSGWSIIIRTPCQKAKKAIRNPTGDMLHTKSSPMPIMNTPT